MHSLQRPNIGSTKTKYTYVQISPSTYTLYKIIKNKNPLEKTTNVKKKKTKKRKNKNKKRKKQSKKHRPYYIVFFQSANKKTVIPMANTNFHYKIQHHFYLKICRTALHLLCHPLHRRDGVKNLNISTIIHRYRQHKHYGVLWLLLSCVTPAKKYTLLFPQFYFSLFCLPHFLLQHK